MKITEMTDEQKERLISTAEEDLIFCVNEGCSKFLDTDNDFGIVEKSQYGLTQAFKNDKVMVNSEMLTGDAFQETDRFCTVCNEDAEICEPDKESIEEFVAFHTPEKEKVENERVGFGV